MPRSLILRYVIGGWVCNYNLCETVMHSLGNISNMCSNSWRGQYMNVKAYSNNAYSDCDNYREVFSNQQVDIRVKGKCLV